ncbi:hypothetical protein Pan216_57750 [Planctomycetes bacterium Pan216]|uniref:DUF8201 domain-containing protein n=1 Tax=Kolteria novifilia TaxID=2527975 RepID=A0A518BD26_9BACT|nr:hypothetical protein Pan216_57750 [Planctomycetes bacterium Pan216]
MFSLPLQSLPITLSVLATWLLSLVVIVGIGMLASRVLGVRHDGLEGGLRAFWIGWATLITLLMTWHYVLPVDARATDAVIGLGVLGWFIAVLDRHPKRLVSRRSLRGMPRHPIFFAGVGVCAGWILLTAANVALGPPWMYDTGLYHIGAVRWSMQYPLVPGLGNLMAQLAFNNSSFLVAALLGSVPPWQEISYHVANGVILLPVVLRWAVSLFRVLARPKRTSLVDGYFLALTPWIYVCAISHEVRSFSTDYVTSLLAVALAGEVLGMFGRRLSQPSLYSRTVVIVALAAVLVTTKASGIIFGTAAALIAGIYYLRRTRAFRAKDLIAIGLLPTLMAVLWVGRNIVLSGYLLFPVPSLGLPVDWRVPRAEVQALADIIKSWARTPGTFHTQSVLGNWSWVAGWAERLWLGEGRFHLVLPLALAAALVPVCLVLRPWRRARGWWPIAFCLAPLVGIGFWFSSAPEVRLVGSLPWIVAAVAIAILPLGRRRWVRLMTVGSLLVVVTISGWPREFHASTSLESTPSPMIRGMLTDGGVVIYTPRLTDQCWDLPLPAAPVVRPKLAMREPGRLECGFRNMAEFESLTRIAAERAATNRR